MRHPAGATQAQTDARTKTVIFALAGDANGRARIIYAYEMRAPENVLTIYEKLILARDAAQAQVWLNFHFCSLDREPVTGGNPPRSHGTTRSRSLFVLVVARSASPSLATSPGRLPPVAPYHQPPLLPEHPSRHAQLHPSLSATAAPPVFHASVTTSDSCSSSTAPSSSSSTRPLARDAAAVQLLWLCSHMN
jgi:hypothetical protein